MDTREWYNKKRWLIVSILFSPLFIFITWKNDYMKTWLRVLLTVPLVLFTYGIIFGKRDKSANQEIATVSAPAPVAELTQEQKDELLKQSLLEEIKLRTDNTISASDLYANYQDNEIAADKNFKGKEFFVVGTINNIGKSFGQANVTLNTTNSFIHIQCNFENENELAELSKNQVVTIRGTCKGMTMYVAMNDCKVVENLKDLKKQAGIK